jgi:hypothetical protein
MIRQNFLIAALFLSHILLAFADWHVWDGWCTTGLGGGFEEPWDHNAVAKVFDRPCAGCSHEGSELGGFETPNPCNPVCEDTLVYVPTGQNYQMDVFVKSTGIKIGWCEKRQLDNGVCNAWNFSCAFHLKYYCHAEYCHY